MDRCSAIVLTALICGVLAGCGGTVLSPGGGEARAPDGGNGPDLQVAAPAVSDAGSDVGTPFTLSATVRNAGGAGAAATTLRFYRSTDAAISQSDTAVGTAAVQELALARSTSARVELVAPSTPGTYYYGACVDAVEGEADTANNCSSSVRVTVPQPMPGPNLVVSSSAVSNSAPVAGTTFTLSATVRNDGDEASPVTTMRSYRSPDATITTSDTEVGTAVVTELDATSYFHGEVEVTAPPTAGTYYYGACVDAVTDESVTTNNCSSSVQVTVRSTEQQVQGDSDLQVGTPTVNDASPESGATITLSATVTNTGEGASEATTLRVYRSTETATTTTHTEVGAAAVRALAASGTSEGSISFAVPRTLGTYYYGACVDAVADETDTTNNCSAPVGVTLVEPEQPEGAPSVSISSASDAVTEGTAALVEVTATPAPAADLDVYLSYYEYMNTGTEITYRPWPPPEPKVTIAAGSSTTTLTVPTIDDSDAATYTLLVHLATGRGYTSDPISFFVYVNIEDND